MVRNNSGNVAHRVPSEITARYVYKHNFTFTILEKAKSHPRPSLRCGNSVLGMTEEVFRVGDWAECKAFQKLLANIPTVARELAPSSGRLRGGIVACIQLGENN